jgi:hypothetical protein
MASNTTMKMMTNAMANSPNESYLVGSYRVDHFVSEYLGAIMGWQLVVAILVILITYDQGMSYFSSRDHGGPDIAQ